MSLCRMEWKSPWAQRMRGPRSRSTFRRPCDWRNGPFRSSTRDRLDAGEVRLRENSPLSISSSAAATVVDKETNGGRRRESTGRGGPRADGSGATSRVSSARFGPPMASRESSSASCGKNHEDLLRYRANTGRKGAKGERRACRWRARGVWCGQDLHGRRGGQEGSKRKPRMVRD